MNPKMHIFKIEAYLVWNILKNCMFSRERNELNSVVIEDATIWIKLFWFKITKTFGDFDFKN